MTLALPGMASAQPAGCTLTPDERNPTEKILRCGDDLTLRSAPGTQYKLMTKGPPLPSGAELNSGALLIEGTHDFQILTPLATAAVRGTKWAVDSAEGKTSVFVVNGRVAVGRRTGSHTVTLGRGEGVDVETSGPLTVKRWPAARVAALMARLGQ